MRAFVCRKRSNCPTVVLIDEYDHSILKHVDNPTYFAGAENLLTSLFIIIHIKNHADDIKLAFVTGITRCSFLHMGSSGCDFTDISDSPRYGTLAGITEEELEHYFQPEIVRLATKRNVKPDIIKNEIKHWYHSYSFSSGMESVYNPKSLSRYFETGVANVYWPQEGRTSFLWDQIKKRPNDFSKVGENEYSFLRQAANINRAHPQTLMYEAGYFTIGNVEHGNVNGPYQLRFANEEVKQAFFTDFVVMTQERNSGNLDLYIQEIRTAITAKPEPDFNKFMAAADTAIRFWPFKCRFEDT